AGAEDRAAGLIPAVLTAAATALRDDVARQPAAMVGGARRESQGSGIALRLRLVGGAGLCPPPKATARAARMRGARTCPEGGLRLASQRGLSGALPSGTAKP